MATGRKTSRRKRGKKAAPARKKARKARPKARRRAKKAGRKKTKTKARPRKTKARRRVRPRARGTRTLRRATVARPMPEAAAMPAAIPAAAPGDDMQAHVEQALRDEGYDEPDQTAVVVLAAIGRGYSRGPARPPDWLAVDANGLVAEGIAERFAAGDRAHDIDRSTHRPQVRATVNFNLDQLGGGDAGDPERDVLASFCLGSWDPAMDANAERNGIASFVVPWYLAGR
jgi:hypothetical protein